MDNKDLEQLKITDTGFSEDFSSHGSFWYFRRMIQAKPILSRQ